MRPPLAALARWRTPSLSARRTLLHGDPAPTPAAHHHHHHHHHRGRRTLLTLAIETSCDDTCVAVLSKSPGPAAAAPSTSTASTAYGGVYPPVALRSHDAHLAPLVAEALASLPPVEEHPGGGGGGAITVSGVPRQKPTFVTVTRGPGMSANLASGLATAKGLAAAWQVPLVAPTPSPRASSPPSTGPPRLLLVPIRPEYPFLTLLVSGGHTQLVHSRSLADHRVLAASADVAVGDALDKAARHILPHDMLASHGDIHKIASSRAGGDDAMPLEERRCLARAAMRLLFEHLASRVLLAFAARPELGDAVRTLVVSGGVASNRFLMHVLRRTLDARGFAHVELTAPPPALCTDNAAMIAWTGMEMYEAGWESALSVRPERKWSIDPASDEGGILGLGGWVRRDE
ncbi:glycoprotease family protein [Colletotrichum tofieldiae]|nr:glycoprotease family protein [Colletotrichum tofieldiae]